MSTFYLVSTVFEWCMSVGLFNMINHVHAVLGIYTVINTTDMQMTTKKERFETFLVLRLSFLF